MLHTPRPPQHYDDADAFAQTIIHRVGNSIRLALPLGLGKANHIANALYRRAQADPNLDLTIITALTLEKPGYSNLLQQRFMAPVVDRLFGDYETLAYAEDRRRGTLPANVRVEEFFMTAGTLVGNQHAQQQFICANYTHALKFLLERDINVVAQLLATDGEPEPAYCMSCNTDLTGDLLAARREGRADFLFVGQVNDQLPFMGGFGLLDEADIDGLLTGESCQFPLFAPPREPVGVTDYAAALHVARLVPDGGTLQIGIGSLGDAIAHSLIMRHRDNPLFRTLIATLGNGDPSGPGAELGTFKGGLHGVSEMLVEGFLDLRDAGILKREVAGKILFGGFFLGANSLYRRLRDLSESEREKIATCSVLFANELYGDEKFKRLQRTNARFINKGMMVTALGEVISDGLENGQVISGVGGQYNFAAQAFALDDARSVIVVPATRRSGGKTVSNILWQYGHCTLPRHLRDIVVTEYGIADLRGKTDAEVIAAMLGVCDSRFQAPLMKKAKRAGKLPDDYRIPENQCNNYPSRIKRIFAEPAIAEQFPAFPFESDFTDTEKDIIPLLTYLSSVRGSKLKALHLATKGLGKKPLPSELDAILNRLALDTPATIEERFYRALVIGAWRETGITAAASS